MTNISTFGIIGGDKRQLYCAKSMADDGYGVYICGFEKCDTLLGMKISDLESTVKNADAFILPLPVTKDGVNLNTPLSDENISLDNFFMLAENKPVFCGTALPFKKNNIFYYGTREEFAVANAVPTSEGAVETAMLEYDGTINNSKCLVAGYGRIGRVLSDMLAGLGADVTASARSLKDLEFIKAKGFHAVSTNDIHGKYDIIFNTVPHMIFNAHILAKTALNALVIDLASMPGGVDFSAAERLNIKAVHALSLPGKVAPKSSGIIIKNAVYNIIREENL